MGCHLRQAEAGHEVLCAAKSVQAVPGDRPELLGEVPHSLLIIGVQVASESISPWITSIAVRYRSLDWV